MEKPVVPATERRRRRKGEKCNFLGVAAKKEGGKGLSSSSFHILFFCSSRKLACTAESTDRPTSTPIVSFQIPPLFQSIRKTDATLSLSPAPFRLEKWGGRTQIHQMFFKIPPEPFGFLT